MAQTLHIVAAQAASGKDEPRHETQILRLELELHVASPWYQRNLVCAGRGDGSFRWIRAQGEIVRNTEGTPIRMLGVHIDVSESRKHQDELRDYSTQLERRNTELDSFAYVASHDLKSPLRNIRQLAEWVIEDSNDNLPEDSKRYLQQMLERIDRMNHLLADLLLYSRAGRVNEIKTSVDIAELIREVIESVIVPEDFQIKVSTSVSTVETCRTPLFQVLLNLVANAIKHHDKPKGTVSVDVCEQNGCLEFRVQDDGPGIPALFQKKIFNIFETLKPKGDNDSTGIGLAIAKKLVENYGGTISVFSQENAGSLFTFTWPM